MNTAYLFDWGDTLMVDFPNQQGQMRYWPKLEVVKGAEAALQSLSVHSKVYIATNAVDSSEADVLAVFERVGLDHYIEGYFCKENIGFSKSNHAFYLKISESLGLEPKAITMIGDSFQNDVLSAQKAGLNTIWFNQSESRDYSGKQIRCLMDLCK